MRKLVYSELMSERLTPEQALAADRFPVSVALHNVRSVYNVGSVFRTCDSARAAELILCGFTPRPPRKDIAKTALGSVDSVPWRYEENVFDAIETEKTRGKKIIAVELTDKKRGYDTLEKNEFPITLLFGNELTGLDDEILSRCDDSVEIPMFGVKHSLNVAVSVGIVLFESVKTIRAAF